MDSSPPPAGPVPPEPPYDLVPPEPPVTPRFPAYDAGTGERSASPAFDLPPSAMVPRSTPRPPMEPGRDPRTSGRQPTLPFDEPWRRQTPDRAGGRLRLRPILIGAAGVVVAGLVAGGFFLLPDGRKHNAPTGPSAQLAGRIFPADPTATADGRDQALAGIVTVGSTVVAIGGESDGTSYRPEFLVSTDGGRAFRLAAVRTLAGDEPPYGDAPKQIAARNGAWVALGDRSDGTVVWTSGDGKVWIRQPDAAGAAFGRNDRIGRVAATASGFIAVGSTSAKGDFSDPTPVVWRSTDGRRWDRVTGEQLNLPGGDAKLSLVGAAAAGNTVIAHGIGSGPGKHPKPIDGLWRSADGGRTWESVSVPRPAGAGGFGIAAVPSGFLVAREAKDKSGPFAAVFGSTDARQWTPSGQIRIPGYARLLRFTGSPQGVAAVAATGRKAALVHSTDGRSWQSAGDVPLPSGRTLSEVVQTPGLTILVGRDGADSDADAMMIVRDAQGQDVQVSLSSVAGAVQPDKTVNAVVSRNGRLVAVGSANGDPAVWSSVDGRTWQRAQTVSRAGKQRLISVAAGNAGLVAVGFDGAAPRHPLVLTSRDGTGWQAADGESVFKASGGAALATYSAAMGPAGYVVVGEDGFSAAVWFSADLKSWQRGGSPEKRALTGTHATGRWMRDVAGGPFGYVAVGGLNAPSTHSDRPGRPAVWASADGRRWTLRQLPLPAGTVEAWFDHVVAKGSVLVATGTATASSGPQAFAFVSPDGGRTWQQTPLAGVSADSAVTAMTVTPRGFVVTGTAGRPGTTDVMLWSSGDGRTWTLTRPKGTGLSGRGDQKLNGLTAVGADLLGVGATSDHLGVQPTLWRRPLL